MKRIILKPRSEFSFLLPEMKEGDVLMHFTPHPQGKTVRYVELNKDKFEIYSKPHWIECGLMEKGLLHDLDLINEHLDEISCYEALGEFHSVKERNIKKKDFDYIGYAAKRLIYILYRMLKNDSFLEINLVGLSISSMSSMFDYVLDTHDKHPTFSCLFILYVDEEFYHTIDSPSIIVSRENINNILKVMAAFFSYNKKVVEMERHYSN